MRRVLSLIALLSVGIACDSKGKDCTAVIDAINVAVERIKHNQVGESDPEKMVADFKVFAKTVEEEAGRIDALPIENAELKTMRGEYVAMANATVGAANELIAAMDAMRSATGKAEKLQKELTATMSEMEKACVGSICLEVMQRIAKTDAGEDDSKLVAELESLAADLSRLQTKNAAVNAAVAAHAQKTKELAEALASMKEAEAKGDLAQKKLDEATAREDPLVDKINGFCGARG